jgi:hypothetical protein
MVFRCERGSYTYLPQLFKRSQTLFAHLFDACAQS